MMNSNLMMSISSTLVLTVLIIFVFINNRNIKEISDSAINVNDYIKKSEANDRQLYKSNDGITDYLKTRDSMKEELSILKKQIQTNKEYNVKQDSRLDDSEEINDRQDALLKKIQDTYRSDINYLVELSVTEVNKHLPNEPDSKNLKVFRDMIFNYVLTSLSEFEELLPEQKLDAFINVYGTDVASILSESIYMFQIYNNFAEFPSISLFKNNLIKDLKQTQNLNFIIKTYFPRMFNYINDKAESVLFPDIEQGGNKTLFTNASEDAFKKYILKDAPSGMQTLHTEVQEYFFISLPTFFTEALYNNSMNKTLLDGLEKNILLNSLQDCSELEIFYKSWTSYNTVKSADSNIVPVTSKSKTLQKLIETNSIFKKIYENKVKEYNAKHKSIMQSKKTTSDESCTSLPIIPVQYRQSYDHSELVTK